MPRTHHEFYAGSTVAATTACSAADCIGIADTVAAASSLAVVSTLSYSIHKRARTSTADLQMKPVLAVALIYLGCLDLGTPILAHNLVAWWYHFAAA